MTSHSIGEARSVTGKPLIVVVVGLFTGLLVPASGQDKSSGSASPAEAASPPAAPPATSAGSVASGPARIGFVDMDIVLQQSHAVQEHVGRIEDQLQSRKKEIERKTAEYSRLREGLERQDSLLSDEEKANRRRRIQELKTEIEDLQYEANRHLRQSESGVIEPVLDAVMATVRQVGEREGYDLILRGELVLYGDPAHDLTDRVIQELDAKALVIPALTDGEPGDVVSGDKDTSPTAVTPRSQHSETETLPLIP